MTCGLLLAAPGTGWAESFGAQDSRSAHDTPEEEAGENLHKPRHGGYFGDADDLYHYEVVLADAGRLILYVNDERNRPLDVRALTGQWIVNPDEAGAVSGTFAPSADGAYFFATLPPSQGDPLHLAVAVLKEDQWATMEFYLPKAGSIAAATR